VPLTAGCGRSYDHLDALTSARRCAVSRYLIVAHETAANPRLIEQVRSLAQTDPQARFSLVVPATHVRHLLRRSHGTDEDVARRRAEEARARFAAAGIELAEARAGAAAPMQAIAEEVERTPGYDGFVISTLPAEKSRWLRENLPGEVRRRYGLPVTHVQATAADVDELLDQGFGHVP
jgi:hypothetical protein